MFKEMSISDLSWNAIKVNQISQELSSPIIEQNACPLPLTENSCVAAEFIVGM